jgi:Domain of unknown function (DUF4276)
VKEIHLYVEGSGPTEATRRPLREGMTIFLGELKARAEGKGIKFKVILCRDKDRTVDAFKIAVANDKGNFHVVLVDSDCAVSAPRLNHYRERFKGSWKGVVEQSCHLMVQVMESWFVADSEALKTFYSDGFNAKPLPKSKDVETVDKDTVLKALETATRKAKKGKYHKIKHASDLLSRIDPDAVRRASRHCDYLFTTLEEVIDYG